MYDQLKFAPRIKATRTSDMNEALKFTETLTVEPHPMKLGELQINEDGTVTNEINRTVTQYGFENLCSILGIPNPFARKIPLDLLFTNIYRLQKDNSDRNIVLLERPDGTVANIVKSPYKELPYSTILSHFVDRKVEYIDVGEIMMTMALTFEETKFTGIGKDDTMYVGTYIYASILKNNPLHLFSGFFRTLCTNSFIAPYLGKVKANYRLEGDERVLRFVDVIRCWDDDIYGRVKENYSSLEDRKLFAHEFAGLWRSVNALIGSGEADSLFKTDEETRKTTMSLALNWIAENKRSRMVGEAINEPLFTTVGAYDALNAITRHAQDFNEVEKMGLEKVGGNFLGKLLLN